MQAAKPIVRFSRWRDADAGGHVVPLYKEDNLLIDELSRYVGAALGSGDSALVIATPAHREALTARLKRNDLDVELMTSERRLLLTDAAETLSTFMHKGWPHAERFEAQVCQLIAEAKAAAKQSQSRVAAFGEMVALLWAEGRPQAAIRLEQLWNELLAKNTATLCCAYPQSAFAADIEGLKAVCDQHSRVFPPQSTAAD
jgi:hypothetical protein